LDSDYADAYYNRALVYHLLENQQKFIQDLDIAQNLFLKQKKVKLAQRASEMIQQLDQGI
jgi:hypothetical protein